MGHRPGHHPVPEEDIGNDQVFLQTGFTFTILLLLFRDGYIDEVKNMKKSLEYAKLIEKKQYTSRKRDANLIKFVYERHPTSSISLDFYKPNMRSKIIRV